ncbi:pantoate--beta-alanine ligase [Desulfuromonas sp. AOP6]|uniref:pantoate--beta-alanine ligase n=1 Tax=Desulfuromonas sp. AOP6 TaxID=1566351 RepID=UPI001270DC6E|nr:pantoate--beta-alanine ligase [Desulfuromonas sp. AOP6]BCA79681.1 pantothenate synthetase [Desulfuromonas sp. AOP6]
MTSAVNKTPEIIRSVSEMQQRCLALREAGKRIAFVPTMGWLHEGHLSLLREGRRRGDVLVLSIFVNPTQFGAGEDFDNYPRDLERDAALAATAGTDLIFAPNASDMYPRSYATYVDVESLTDALCGASRPGHFRGVTTVVTKLFTIVQPHVALFGQKDFQQLAVICRMTIDLNLPVDVIGMPIVREADGLAMSSRNVYLSEQQRRQALVLSRALAMARQMAAQGQAAADEVIAELRQLIAAMPEARIDYIQICHQQTLQQQAKIDHDSVLLLAVFIGQTRLIDNGFLLDSAPSRG